MKIGGRIIQTKNIELYTQQEFAACYKRHTISVVLIELGHTNEYSIEVRDDRGILAVQTTTKRCTIRDAIIVALDGAKL